MPAYMANDLFFINQEDEVTLDEVTLDEVTNDEVTLDEVTLDESEIQNLTKKLTLIK